MNSAPPLIVHVVYRFDIGGLENGIVNLINRLPEVSWRHAVLSLTDVNPSFARRVQRRDVQYVSLNKPLGHLWKLYPRLLREFRRLQPAVVHTRNLAALEAVIPAALAGVRARIHGEHGRDTLDPDGNNRRYQWVRRAYSPFVSRYVAVSRDLQRYLSDRAGVASQRITQIYNGVDTDQFRPANQRTPIEGCPFAVDHWLVGTVGRLDPIKDQSNLTRAFVRALQINPAACNRMRLVIVGSGELRSECERILHDANAQSLAWFAGERHDVSDIMRGLDCFVLPSLGEGISNTILEAMGSALPVIATKVGGNTELIADGVTGCIVPPADAAQLANAIVRYFADPALSMLHGLAARRKVEESFGLKRMANDYHHLYLAELTRSGYLAAHSVSDLPSAS